MKRSYKMQESKRVNIRLRTKKEFLISEIKRFVREFDRVPTPTDFDKLESYPSRKTFTNHLGRFEEALLLAGYEATYINDWYKKDVEYRTSYIIDTVKYLCDLNGTIPTIEELVKYSNGAINRQSIRKDFESYSNVLNICGITDKSSIVNGKYTDEYLKIECDSLYELIISTWLQDNKVNYERNVPYTKRCTRYNGKMNCDYKITVGDKSIYVEMAGFLPKKHLEWDKFSSEEKNYARKMGYKKK